MARVGLYVLAAVTTVFLGGTFINYCSQKWFMPKSTEDALSYSLMEAASDFWSEFCTAVEFLWKAFCLAVQEGLIAVKEALEWAFYALKIAIPQLFNLIVEICLVILYNLYSFLLVLYAGFTYCKMWFLKGCSVVYDVSSVVFEYVSSIVYSCGAVCADYISDALQVSYFHISSACWALFSLFKDFLFWLGKGIRFCAIQFSEISYDVIVWLIPVIQRLPYNTYLAMIWLACFSYNLLISCLSWLQVFSINFFFVFDYVTNFVFDETILCSWLFFEITCDFYRLIVAFIYLLLGIMYNVGMVAITFLTMLGVLTLEFIMLAFKFILFGSGEVWAFTSVYSEILGAKMLKYSQTAGGMVEQIVKFTVDSVQFVTLVLLQFLQLALFYVKTVAQTIISVVYNVVYVLTTFTAGVINNVRLIVQLFANYLVSMVTLVFSSIIWICEKIADFYMLLLYQYNVYREGLFLLFIILISIYCYGLFMDRSLAAQEDLESDAEILEGGDDGVSEDEDDEEHGDLVPRGKVSHVSHDIDDELPDTDSSLDDFAFDDTIPDEF